MQFTPRIGGNQCWRSDFQPVRDRPQPNNREWSGWNSPKTYFNNKPKHPYRGSNVRSYHKPYGYPPSYGNRQNNSFRNEFPNGGRGRPGWRKQAYGNNKRSYEAEEGPRWRGSHVRRVSPLRSRDNSSPRRPDAKRARLERPDKREPRSDERDPRSDERDPRPDDASPRPDERAGKENGQLGRPARRSCGDASPAAGWQGQGRAGASQQMRPPPSPRKAGDSGKALQLYGGKAAAARDVAQLTTVRADTSHLADPLHIGLPNYGNSCYQNATLQSLLGLRPFLQEVVSLTQELDGDRCRTLTAVAKLMVLRQRALSKSVSDHLNDLREVFARIDPVFRGNEMQDANEFLLRLLDTIKEEIDGGQPPCEGADPPQTGPNPVRDNFQYQTVESYCCTKCHESVLKRQDNISWFVSVPRRRGTEPPSLQDALRLSMRPDRRELHCQSCKHNECRVTTKISKLPRTLILQLNRYVFLGEESKKIRANVEIPKFLSLNEYIAEDVVAPPQWNCTKLSLSPLVPEPDGGECVSPERPPAPRPASPPAAAPPTGADEAAGAPVTVEDDDRELQEAIMRSLEEGEPADSAAEQARLSEFCVEDQEQEPCQGAAADPSGAHSYRLVALVSHYGRAAHSGHYVSHVYSVGRDRWYHYDDRRVSCVDEADVLGDGHQRNGYIFFYLHKDLCTEVVRAEAGP